MFTGLIEQVGRVVAHKLVNGGSRLMIKATWGDALNIGESIAVNGVCLTLLSDDAGVMAFDVSPETLRQTTMHNLQLGSAVNLERALMVGARMGGHYVSGHVDGVARLLSLQRQGDYLEMRVGGFQECDTMYLLPKGSITLDGVSLTINQVLKDEISLMLVPHTLSATNLEQKKMNDEFNVEFDYVARIVAHQVRSLEVPR